MADEKDDGNERDRLLRCRLCGKTTACTQVEMMSYLTAGWPKCCGETMTLFIEAKLPDGVKS
jgi:phage FluMu protein Com